MRDKEIINVKDLFEKYRPTIDTTAFGWSGESLEEYMEEEGYGHGVYLFIVSIEYITKGEYFNHTSKTLNHPEYYDTTYEEVIIKRKDGKYFKLDVCCEHGEYSDEMVEVIKKSKTITIFE